MVKLQWRCVQRSGDDVIELVLDVLPRGGSNRDMLEAVAFELFGPHTRLGPHVVGLDVRSSRVRVFLRPSAALLLDAVAEWGPLKGLQVAPSPAGGAA